MLVRPQGNLQRPPYGKGGITKQGEQVVLGAEDKYISLCRRHWKQGDPGPKLRKQ